VLKLAADEAKMVADGEDTPSYLPSVGLLLTPLPCRFSCSHRQFESRPDAAARLSYQDHLLSTKLASEDRASAACSYLAHVRLTMARLPLR
jgi:hypothetical protein